MGVSLFPRKAKAEPDAPSQSAPPAPAPPPGGPERLTANEWAKKLNFNEVAAERSAMRAGKWHELFTEEEFLELLRKHPV